MPRRRSNFVAITRPLVLLTAILATETAQRPASAASDLLAVTGDMQPGSAAELLGISAATLNEAGQVAFRATLKPGVGPINSTNNRAIWRIAGATPQLVAQAGVGGVPGGGSFDVFQAASIGDAGEVIIRASTTSGQVGIWRYPPSPGGDSRIAATGVIGVPEFPNAQFDAIGFSLRHASDNVVVINGRLESGVGGVSSDNDFGIWLDDGGQQTLIAREQFTPAPGIDGAIFQLPTAVSVNDHAQVAILATLEADIGGVESDNSIGVWRMSASGGDLIARQGVGAVAGLPGAAYSTFADAAINNAGQIVFGAQLIESGAVTPANNRGIWLHDGTAGALLAQSGAAAPDVPGATFAAFESPLLNDGGQVLIQASLVEGMGGVTASNAQGLWIVESGGGSLLARTGSAGVPGVPGAHFASFGDLAFNELGVAAVQASLVNVAPGTDQGLWLMDEMGDGVLVARTGDVVGARTIAALEFADGSDSDSGRPRALNSNGQLAYKATFTNGDEGLFLFSPASSADFTFDGHVSAADLLAWKLGFGQSLGAGRAQGDADADGDVDGGDFLLWQRQLSASVPLATIPEPSLAVLLLPAWVVGVLRLNRGAGPAR